ncbi:MAG TPA: excinuclease ABC subunit UvrA [Candidatus Coprenecus avistercoris]|uniref:UvrABC system protein A n=1 Tax=Candidatus Coprenecus avistercoris TaxID=2840730 RepID=A0A9D1E1E1_9BACT|nr:excinuclease ABC subunit UvrA [Candidatus Coprenecus avistercoris]
MQDSGYIDICKASVHNLKGISLRIPRHALVVITGLSGSGKSSLAFDTIYAEARRRYMDTLSAYARHYIGVMERPEVESIDGLSPTIAIEQKSTNRNPRSTVGTITEISDFLRLLYARASTAYSPVTGKPMVKYTDSGIVDLIMKEYAGRKCIILAPLVKGRKGHYRELFDSLLKKGLSYARIDGEIRPLGDMTSGVDRYKVHFIEAVIDRVVPKEEDGKRIRASVLSALTQGKGSLMILDPETGEVRHFSKHFICPDSGISFPEPAPHTFSFNSPAGACPVCNGLGTVREVDMAKIVPDPSLSIADGGIAPLGKKRDNAVFTVLEAVARKYGFSLFDPIKDIPQETMNIILNGSEDLIRVDTRGGLSEMITFPGLLSRFEGDGEEDDDSVASRYSSEVVCPECHGKRLRKDSLCFKIGGLDIAEVSDMDVSVLYDWVGGLKDKLDPRGQAVAADIVKELRERIGFLVDVGLSYLSLSRSTMSLSGGESQRIRLATQIGSKLVNVLYILDEPSIGLHQSDNIKLINSLRRLRDEGNTVMVVEHDEEMMRSADWIVDIGPGAGEKGGEVLFSGPPQLKLDPGYRLPAGLPVIDRENEGGLTFEYLKGSRQIEVPSFRRPGNGKFITLRGASGNNLKDVDISLPLGCIIGISGVSGSGKSSLINDTLMPVISNRLYRSRYSVLPYRSLEGLENIDKLVEIDQSPVGRSPRSNPATYTGVLTYIRNLFAETPDAKIRGFKSNKFSFNVKGGRCEACKGAGVEVIEMNFLPSVTVTCKECHGKRFNPDVLAVKYKGKSINDVLEMTISQAVEFFAPVPSIARKLKTLEDVGLGYIRLGQSSLTLSGGENQRVKIAAELARQDTGRTLYILDEPTTGLHSEDIAVLMNVLQRLAEGGNTVVIIEHNLDVLKSVDYLFDMGPAGGRDGGRIVSQGTPEQVAADPASVTGPYLRTLLKL